MQFLGFEKRCTILSQAGDLERCESSESSRVRSDPLLNELQRISVLTRMYCLRLMYVCIHAKKILQSRATRADLTNEHAFLSSIANVTT